MAERENGPSRGITAVILVGGRASRYGGTPKGLIEVAPGVTILARTIAEIQGAGVSDIAISANEPGPYEAFGLPIVADLRQGVGPIGGIEAGLAHFRVHPVQSLVLECSSSGRAPSRPSGPKDPDPGYNYTSYPAPPVPMAGTEPGHYIGVCDAVLFMPSDLPGITTKEISTLIAAYRESGSDVVFVRDASFFDHSLCAVVHIGLLTAVSGFIDEGHRKVADVWMRLGAMPVQFEEDSPFFNVNTPADLARWRGE